MADDETDTYDDEASDYFVKLTQLDEAKHQQFLFPTNSSNAVNTNNNHNSFSFEALNLPTSLLQAEDLSQIFNMDTWDSLAPQEKDALKKYLPKESEEQTNCTLKSLFSNQNFSFGNPVSLFEKDLRGGKYDWEVSLNREQMKELNQRNHQYYIHAYTNQMMFRILKWKQKLGIIDESELTLLSKYHEKFSQSDLSGFPEDSTEGVERKLGKRNFDFDDKNPNKKKKKYESRKLQSQSIENPFHFLIGLQTILQENQTSLSLLSLAASPSSPSSSSSSGLTLEQMLQRVENDEKLSKQFLPSISSKAFLFLALNFLADPPVLPFVHTTTVPRHDDPITAFDPATNLWTWKRDVTNEYLQGAEQIFYFCVSRRQFNEAGTHIILSNLRQTKCACTIPPTPPEMVATYREQEALRYKSPERPFTFHFNGAKCVVAPVKRSSGTTNKAREHFLLKAERPVHINLLALVRDAASRLPGNVGTRPDVGLLLKDSQFIEESVTDNQINTVVSGVLDRLQSEKEPCVRFDPDEKIWIYLHRNKTEEDLEPQKKELSTSSSSQLSSQASPPSSHQPPPMFSTLSLSPSPK